VLARVDRVTDSPLVSYAQNAEDVVLWRALGHLPSGRYVDIGANSPVEDSVTKVFYDRGWSGLDVEPVAEFAEELRSQRSRDVVVEAVVSGQDGGELVLHEFKETGLSTLRAEFVTGSVERGHSAQERSVASRTLQGLIDEHLPGQEVHFCKIDVEGAEAEVLGSVDLTRWRPWVLVVEATRPNSPEPTHPEWEPAVLGAGYQLTLFDGLSRFYVSDEHADALRPALSYPACPLDDFIRRTQVALATELFDLQQVHHETVQELAATGPRLAALQAEVRSLRAELVRWRGTVLERWASATAPAPVQQDRAASEELEAMRATLSWRVTTPLRTARSRQLRSRA